jgi:hypothetical protein
MKSGKAGLRPIWWRLLRWLIVIAIVVIIGGFITWVILNNPRPKGTPGPEAELLAKELLHSVNASAWKETGAVRFTFANHQHFWDRRRNYDRVEWGKHKVLLRIADRTGRAWENGVEVKGERASELVQEAYAQWVNDSFWLNPVVKIFDLGVTRNIVRDEKGTHLLVEYRWGGLTPGDAYLWSPGANGLPPTAWRIWAQRLPIGGLYASWEGWIQLSTGAKVSTWHRIGPFTLVIKDVAGANSLSKLLNGSPDPFACL